jgi:hypothetical protein
MMRVVIPVVVIPASDVSPRAGTQGHKHRRVLQSWVPDIAQTRNSGMTAEVR